MSRDIGIFGGKFDPPHLGHKMTVDLAFEKYQMDEVWIIPSHGHPLGYESSSFMHRVEMCRIMAGIWKNSTVKVLETEKEINSGFTIDIIRHFLNSLPGFDLHLFIGADNWNIREKWKEFDQLEQLCKKIIVTGRGNDTVDGFSLPDISSTQIKEMIKKGLDPSPLLPDGIMEYIRKHKLYN